ncbi:MAG: HPr family phosphocarrier protein [Betaproteobacteria bacterium]|nr:HPr family phosphocarrier protein [Betaproteobacteria bacterium]MDE2622094.1 HPr family phosphocarrier protein [Betaproteobacteria bacterium]
MPARQIEIINKLGLHARASAKLTQTASAFPCDVTVARNGRRVNAKSIMGVMMLAATRGTTVTIETEGPEADAALEALTTLINNRFDEPE